MCGFYKLNNSILKFDYDSLEVRFNHFLMKRENLQRVSNELKRGQFKLSYPIIEKEFGIVRSKAQRLVKSFVDMGIIEPILITKVRGTSSVYGYISAYEEDENVGYSTDKQNDKSKKENIKRNNIYTDTINSYTKNIELVDAINDFIAMRKQMKKPLTTRALKGIFKKLDVLGESDIEKIEMLENSIVNCWLSVFELKNKKEPIGVGPGNKKTNYNDSICNSDVKYSYGREVL